MAEGEALHHVILDVSGASHMDTTAVEAISEWQEGYAETGMHLALVDPGPHIVAILHRSGCLSSGMYTLYVGAPVFFIVAFLHCCLFVLLPLFFIVAAHAGANHVNMPCVTFAIWGIGVEKILGGVLNCHG